MKKVLALILVLTMAFMLVSCSGKEENVEHDEIMATYSIKNENSKNIIVEVQNLGGVYEELYDEDGITIKFKSGEEIYDAQGKKIKRKDLNIGDMLVVTYDSKDVKDNPKTIYAYKLTKAN